MLLKPKSVENTTNFTGTPLQIETRNLYWLRPCTQVKSDTVLENLSSSAEVGEKHSNELKLNWCEAHKSLHEVSVSGNLRIHADRFCNKVKTNSQKCCSDSHR